jgi:hypothetical protein
VSGTGGRGNDDFEDMGESVEGFRSTRGGVTARFAAPQAGIIRTLVSQVAELVGGDQAGGDVPAEWWPDAGPLAQTGQPGQGGQPREGAQSRESGQAAPGPGDLAALLGLSDSTSLPKDPVLARLLPDAYQDDPEAAGDFRRYTEQDLRSGKVAAARTVLATLPDGGGRVELSETDGQVWLRALNDVRLALGVRLGVTEDIEQRMAELDPDDPRSAYFWVYDWLTFLQETLVRALW